MTPEQPENEEHEYMNPISVLRKSRSKPISLKEFLILYLDDMRADEDLIELCRTKREKALAYAVIALNSRIMEKANPISMYAVMVDDEPETEDDFSQVKSMIGVEGYEMTEEKIKYYEELERQVAEMRKSKAQEKKK